MRLSAKTAVAVAALAAGLPSLALANDELLAMQNNSAFWPQQNGDYANTRYSELAQINRENVKDLQVAWTFSTGVLRGHEGGHRARCRSRPGRPPGPRRRPPGRVGRGPSARVRPGAARRR